MGELGPDRVSCVAVDLSGTALHIALVTDQKRRITEKKRVGHNQSTTTVIVSGGPGRSGGELQLNAQCARPLRFSELS